MLNLSQLHKTPSITEIARQAIILDIAGTDDLKRATFDIYVTLCYHGFYSSELLGYHEVLDNVPKEYLPCSSEQASDFFISHVTIDRIVKRYTEFVFNSISVSPVEKSKLKSIAETFPMTIDQFNCELLMSGICPNPISYRALLVIYNELLESNTHYSSLLNFLSTRSRKEDGSRYERNTRPSYISICETEFTKELKAFSTFIVRTSEVVARLIGIVNSEHIAAIVGNLKKKNVSSLFYHKDDFVSYVDSVVGLKFKKSYSDGIAISDELEQSEVYRLLYHYMSIKKSLPMSSIPEFLKRLLRFKVEINAASKSTAKKEVLSTKHIYNAFDSHYITTDSQTALIAAIDFLTIEGNALCFDESATKYFDDNFSTATSIGLSYLEKGNVFQKNSDSERVAHILQNQYADEFLEKLNSVLKDSDGMLSIEGDRVTVDSGNIVLAENRRGQYHNSEYLEISEEIFYHKTMLEDEVNSLKDRFKARLKAFQTSWKSPSNNLPDIIADKKHPNHREYMEARHNVLSSADYDSAYMYLVNENKRCEKQIASLTKYYNYIQTIDGVDGSDYSTTVKNTQERITNWGAVKALNLELIDELRKADHVKEILDKQSMIEELEIERRKLRIRYNEFKAHLLIHDFVVSSTSKPLDEVKEFIKDYYNVLSNNKLPQDKSTAYQKQFDGVYHNLRRVLLTFVESHPFATS